jgi:hypothetical protein
VVDVRCVRHIARQHRLQLPLTNDQHPIQQLTTDGANAPQDPDALGTEDRIEAVGEDRIRSRMRNLNCPTGVCAGSRVMPWAA